MKIFFKKILLVLLFALFAFPSFAKVKYRFVNLSEVEKEVVKQEEVEVGEREQITEIKEIKEVKEEKKKKKEIKKEDKKDENISNNLNQSKLNQKIKNYKILEVADLEIIIDDSDKKLHIKELIKKAEDNYPKILSLYEEINVQKNSILSNQGFFDVKLKQEYRNRTRGYYDGEEFKTEISKQNQFLGSEVYGGYRKSRGSFENHETKAITANDGEFNFGARFSLLRNAFIDENRLALSLSRLDLEESKLALENIKNEIRRDATKAYFNWIASYKIYKIYKNLYNLALERNKQLEYRVKKGDLAKIILIENERNALSRKTAMQNAEQEFENSAIFLSLFNRDKDGNPVIVNKNQVPEFDLKESLQKLSFANFSKNKSHAILNRPDVNIINVAQKKERENLKQAKNLFKPKLDLKIEASNDIGNANQALGQSKNLIGLKFEIPFQQRRARGSVGKAESKLRRIEYEKKLLLDKIKVKLDQIRIRINNITEIHDNLTKEVSYSLQLEKAEMQRFKKGGSDFFLINLRETTTAQARIENNKIFAEYYKTLADYAAETFTEIKIDNF